MKEKAEIVRKDYTSISPYVKLVRKDVKFAGSSEVESYHGIAGNDYVCMIAVTEEGKIPLVRQFRPIVERYVWELPAGTVDDGERPQESAIRELREETGFSSRAFPVDLGKFAADTGRLEIYAYGYLFTDARREGEWTAEKGVECRLFTPEEIKGLISDGEFLHVMHVAYLYLSSKIFT